MFIPFLLLLLVIFMVTAFSSREGSGCFSIFFYTFGLIGFLLFPPLSPFLLIFFIIFYLANKSADKRELK